MASFYKSTVGEFLEQAPEHVLAHLSTSYAREGYTSLYSDQTLTWERDLVSLRNTLLACVEQSADAHTWGILLEFSIPRKEKRIDAVLLVRDAIVVLEAKSGIVSTPAKRQLEEYALLLHYFHKASANRRIIPIAVSSHFHSADIVRLNQTELFPQMSAYWISEVSNSSWDELPDTLIEIHKHANGQLNLEEWDDSPYFPVPSIIDAAIALRSGLSIRQIAQSEASEHEIDMVCQTIQRYVDKARTERQHAICFLTGVPGSGKTLVGLGLAHSEKNSTDTIHFMSGNGPLVKVLQQLFTNEGRKTGASAPEARAKAQTLIENIHVFARYHTDTNAGAPFNHAIIFDEAQRAWNREQNKKKFKREYSEPEMLLRIMERHDDWAIVVALVGGGQEINDGEAGLEEWGRALQGAAKDWVIYASPEVLEGGASTAGHRLFSDNSAKHVVTNPSLHLRTSNRSLRAENLATWVNHVLDGNAREASALKVTERFPIFITRDLKAMRNSLHQQRRGTNRYGLVGSSGAARLRAEGLETNSSFHADYPWHHWYLADAKDIRSSYQCEVLATEFEIQGLELDWIGVCWGGDFVWSSSAGWKVRNLHLGENSKWNPIKNPDRQIFRRNAYRVLLTRARQGMVLFIPRGDKNDPTQNPDEFDATYDFLLRCGVIPIA